MVNPETALVMYKELVYRIDENALDFKRAGVTKGELLGELEETKKDAGDNVVCIDECKSDGYQRAEKTGDSEQYQQRERACAGSI